VTYDSTAYECFEVHKVDGTKRVFKPSKKGQFYSCVNNDVALVTTVENNTNKYTVREYSYAKKARYLQKIIGRPSTQDLINYIDKNLMPNCPVTRQDILRLEDIFGPNIGLVKRKTTYTTQKHVEVHLQDIPQEIMEKHGEIILAIDIMFINKILFVMTISRNIHFGTTELVNDMKNNTLVTSIEQVIQAYQTGGFKIKAILANGQFKHIQQIVEQRSTYVQPLTCTRNQKVHQNHQGKSAGYCHHTTI